MVSIIGNQVAFSQFGEAAIGKIVARGELIEPTNFVNLTIQFKDGMGNLVDTDIFPTVSIIGPSGTVILGSTSQGVGRVSLGQYNFLFQAPIAGPFGVFNDLWRGYINGFLVEQTFSFVISHTDLPNINSDGYIHLGDDPGFQYSQGALFNVNKCLKMMRARLNSSGKAKSTDVNGNVIYVNCDIYSVEMMTTFIAMSLSKFNTTPFFTSFTFEDSHFFANFAEVIAEGAVLFALSSQALIERGREFTLTDNGINFNPPSVSELLNTQFNTELTHLWDQVKMIKASMRHGPLGLGVWGMTSAMNPAIKRLQGLRARRIV